MKIKMNCGNTSVFKAWRLNCGVSVFKFKKSKEQTVVAVRLPKDGFTINTTAGNDGLFYLTITSEDWDKVIGVFDNQKDLDEAFEGAYNKLFAPTKKKIIKGFLTTVLTIFALGSAFLVINPIVKSIILSNANYETQYSQLEAANQLWAQQQKELEEAAKSGKLPMPPMIHQEAPLAPPIEPSQVPISVSGAGPDVESTLKNSK